MSERWDTPKTRRAPGDWMPASERRALMIEIGLDLAKEHGFERVNRAMVAERGGCSPSLLSYYWTALGFQTALMEAAAADPRHAHVLAQGLTARHPVALAAPIALRRAAALSIVGDQP